MSTPEFDTEGLFDEDYLYFYADRVGDPRSEADIELVWRLLGLRPEAEVLDLACGHGRIANRLAERGCRVTGLDVTPLFLDRAREGAQRRGVSVDYVRGDMRELPWASRFDVVISWFTAYGYFDDIGNRRVLDEVFRALRPGGRFVIDMNNYAAMVCNWQSAVVSERDGNLMIDRKRFEPLTGRDVTERTVIRDGRTRRVRYDLRLFTFTEIRTWLHDAGFTSVAGYGEDGGPLTADHRRMLVVAER